MEFGIQVEPQFGFTYDAVVEISKAALDNGFTMLWFSDHFMLDANATDRVLIDPWILMSGLVRDNDSIRVGSMVFCNSYRNPALTAKMVASLDHISNGRFEFGYGAGWKKIEYNAYGYEFPADKIRMEQLAEGVQIIRGILSNDRFSFSGKHYDVADVISYPKPSRKPFPIWIGTMKAKDGMLDLIAKYGDGINVAWAFTPDRCAKIFARLDELAEKHGRRSGAVRRSVGLWTRCFKEASQMESAIKEGAKARGISTESYRKRIDAALWGTPEMLVEKLKQYQNLNLSHMILMFPHEQEIEQIGLFGKEVLPRL